jgi:outer membrane protein TolC
MLTFGCAFSQSDEAKIRQIEFDMMLAETRVSATGLWSRLRPSVNVSASFSLKDGLFYDSESFVLYPRDSYRITITFPLHELLATQKHEEALIERRRLESELSAARRDSSRGEIERQSRLAASEDEMLVLKEELSLLQEIVHFDSLLFEEGKIKFDALARARLQALQTERMVLDRTYQLERMRRNNALD